MSDRVRHDSAAPAAWDERFVRDRWERIAEWWTKRIRAHEHGDLLRRQVLTPTILSEIGDQRGTSALDVGCGEGYLVRLLRQRGLRATGIDISEPLVRRATELGRRESDTPSHFLVGSASALPFRTGCIDTIISNMMLMDVPDYRLVIRELGRVARLGGTVLVSILDPDLFDAEGHWAGDANDFPAQFHRLPAAQGDWARLVRLEPEATVETPYFQRSVEAYEQAFMEHGRFQIESSKLITVSSNETHVAGETSERVEYLRVRYWQLRAGI